MTFVVTAHREFFGKPNSSSPHEASGGIYKPQTPIDKEVWCMDLQFYLEQFEFMKVDHASFPLASPSNFSSLLPSLNDNT